MNTDHPPPLGAFVPALAWPGRRPSLAELGTWHEALCDAVGHLMEVDLLGCWLLPNRGTPLLIGPPELAQDRIVVPEAEPLVPQEGLFALEDRIRSAGYHSVMAVPIRSEVQDVGILVVGRFEGEGYRIDELRALHRVAAQLATSFRRLASQPWITPAVPSEDRTAMVAGVAEALLDAVDRARHGADLVQLASDAIGAQVPHDRFELVAVAPAPDCWALLSREGLPSETVQLEAAHLDQIDGIVHHLGSQEAGSITDLHALGLNWPGPNDRRIALRQRSLLGARLEVGGELVGWLWLGHDQEGWFSEADQSVVRLTARILASRVATWTARHELAGAWG
jgi:GAF domain-containing protein